MARDAITAQNKAENMTGYGGIHVSVQVESAHGATKTKTHFKISYALLMRLNFSASPPLSGWFCARDEKKLNQYATHRRRSGTKNSTFHAYHMSFKKSLARFRRDEAVEE